MELRIKVVMTEKMKGKKSSNLCEVKITGFDEHTVLQGRRCERAGDRCKGER